MIFIPIYFICGILFFLWARFRVGVWPYWYVIPLWPVCFAIAFCMWIDGSLR